MGRGRNKLIVYSYEDLASVWPLTGTRGMFAFHANFHDGHRRCAMAVQDCDWVVGMMFNNMADSEQWLTGRDYSQRCPINDSDIAELQRYCDFGIIIQGNYFPERCYRKKIESEFREAFPIECLMEKEILSDHEQYTRLFYAVAFRYMVHGVYGIYWDRQAQCGKDRFRSLGYTDYVQDRWGVKIDLLDPVEDEFGNAVSKSINGLPIYLKNRLSFKLLLPEFRSILDVQEHVKPIEDLKVLNFYLSESWVHATFAFEGYKPWTEGVRRWR